MTTDYSNFESVVPEKLDKALSGDYSETPAPPRLDQTTLVWIMADLEDRVTTLRAQRDFAWRERNYEAALHASAGLIELGKWAQHVIRTYTGKDHEELMEGAHSEPIHE